MVLGDILVFFRWFSGYFSGFAHDFNKLSLRMCIYTPYDFNKLCFRNDVTNCALVSRNSFLVRCNKLWLRNSNSNLVIVIVTAQMKCVWLALGAPVGAKRSLRLLHMPPSAANIRGNKTKINGKWATLWSTNCSMKKCYVSVLTSVLKL